MSVVLYGKFGLSLHFDEKEPEEFVSWFGSMDAVKMLVNLAYHAPDDTFVVIGRNNLSRQSPGRYEKLFPHKNVVDIWKHASSDDAADFSFPLREMERLGLSPDYGVFFSGTQFSRSVPSYTRKEDGTFYVPSSMAARSNGPLIYTLNVTDVPWVRLDDDPRPLLTPQKDLANVPKAVLSQITTETTYLKLEKHGHSSLVEHREKVYYAGVEQSCVLDETIYPLEDLLKMKTVEFGIALNRATKDDGTDPTKPVLSGTIGKVEARYPILREYVLSKYEEAEIYGDWPEEVLQRDSKYFKGAVSRHEVQRKMRTWKNSLCVPIAPGWATTKYLELLRNGCRPYFHPLYDSQKNVPIPDYWRHGDPNFASDASTTILEETRNYLLRDSVVSGYDLRSEIYDALEVLMPTYRSYEVRDLWTVESKAPAGSLTDFF